MKFYAFTNELWLPAARERVFSFFSAASNLEAITPPWLRFEVLTPEPIRMGTGTLIDYRIRIHGIPIRWRTEITRWNPPESFVDVQLRGPYRLWFHEHTFQVKDGGTLCTDLVRYRPRGGGLLNWLFVRRDVERIFAFRGNKLRQLFPA